VLVWAAAAWRLEVPGVGPLSAAQVLVSWSHAGRFRSEAAFAALAGVNPIPASSGQVVRYRLNRGGDRQPGPRPAPHRAGGPAHRSRPPHRPGPPNRRGQEPPRRQAVPAARDRPPAVAAAGTLRPARRRDPPSNLTAHSSLRLSSVKSAQRRTTSAGRVAGPSGRCRRSRPPRVRRPPLAHGRSLGGSR
jgi:Transposase IS116/IS110/IS902 family